MGKGLEDQSVPVLVHAQTPHQNADNRCTSCRFFRFKCVFVLLLGIGVLLSALFWLPPFFRNGDREDLDLDFQFKGWDIVASFMVNKSVSFLEDNSLRLEGDILDEIGVATTKVQVIALEPSVESNVTKVVFGVESIDKKTRLSSAAKSLIRSNFVTLIIRESPLRLTESLFGDPFSFDVLKFKGGVTVSPPQKAFLLQKVQILFNFSLNFSIDQIQDNFIELTTQLKSGLQLAPFENLYISLTNSRGSTVEPPTIVQTSVLLAVGNTPSRARLKQLAQTITGPHSKNLGLNNTQFGKVKQVSLSSWLQHSLGDGDSPSPSPAPHPNPHHHHHHHHHHHRPPSTAPAPETRPPELSRHPGCHFHKKALPPIYAPVSLPEYGATAPAPQRMISSPAPEPVVGFGGLSPVPNVAYAHKGQPPSVAVFDPDPPDISPAFAPLQSSSSTGIISHIWAIMLFVALVLNL